jgi:signal transduction histidine kinase
MAWADPDQLKQVLINLLFNSCDALNEGGGVSIATTRRPCAETKKGGSGQVGAGVVEISVSDTGKGIPPSELSKIFDPFYTTKPPGKGTGLGLPISLRIIESFGGNIAVNSTEGKGTAFLITLKPWESKHDS